MRSEDLLDLFQLGPLPEDAISGFRYNAYLVTLSYLIAVLASYVALDMASRLRAESNPRAKLYWLLGGAFAMGAGIWSMHFIGMLAFVMPIPMSFGVFWTTFSLLVAIVASGFALFLLRKENRPLVYLLAGGILLGLGIAAMHYIGMKGMQQVQINYRPKLFILSVAIAILASEIALLSAVQSNIGSFKRQLYFKIMSAFVMGAGICGMHYTGMAAAIFTPLYGMASHVHALPPYGLAFYIAIITATIMGVALLASTHKQLMIHAARTEKDFLNAILDNLEDGIIACDSKGKITLLNKAMHRMIDLPMSEHVFRNWLEECKFYHPNNETPLQHEENPLVLALQGKRISSTELILAAGNSLPRHVKIDGQPIMNGNKKNIGAVIAVHDITKQKKMESLLIRQATHDILTDLPNRLLLIDRIEQSIHLAKRNNTIIGLLFLDVDNFKLINDNFGHSAGDEVLLIIAKRLRECIRESDTISRIGGDEFVVLLTSLEDEAKAIAMAHRMLLQLSEPFQIADNKMKLTISIGISSYPKNGEDPDTLLKNADTAMYRAKTQGRNNIKFYSEEMNIRTVKRLELEQHLYDALDRKEYLLYYQPIVDLHSGYILGFEALLRWEHPTLGLLLPAEFIPLMEETGLIISVGEWVLNTACVQNKAWQEEGLPPVRISINVSGRQINESNFFKTVKDALNKTKLDSKYLELELTESSILKHPVETLKTLNELKELGVNIVLDDFGIGYSSLGYLSKLPVDKLKIDQSFVRNIEEHAENAAIVLAIISMASSMKLKVTAEGMETRSELAFLRFNRCDEVQGYYFSKPLTEEDATKLLRENPKLEVNQHVNV